MDSGKFIYSRPGDDTVIAELPVASYAYILGRELLVKGGVRKPSNEDIAFMAALALAEASGVEGIDVLDRDFVSAKEMRREMLRHDFEFTVGEPGGGEAPVDENPTGTSAGSL